MSNTSRQLLSRGMVHNWHLDHFGHMNARWYLHFFDDAAFLALSRYGLDVNQLMTEHGVHTVSGRGVLSFIKELKVGDLVAIEGAMTRVGNKSITLEFDMIHDTTGETHARYELTEVFFDPGTRKSAVIPDPVRDKLNKFVVASM